MVYMKIINAIIFTVMIISVIFLSGCLQSSSSDDDVMMAKDDAMVKDDTMMTDDDHMVDDMVDEANEMMESDSMMTEDDMMMDYSGSVLAGSSSPYLEYNKEDFDKAIAENKIIVLYFYANWCPTCKAEESETYAAFDELDNSNVVGFRVNYKDSETDSDEAELAKKYGITYQHTKIILKDGERVLKAPDSWKKDRYIEEINKVI